MKNPYENLAEEIPRETIKKMAEDAEIKKSIMTIDFVLASTYETMFIPRKISRQGHQNSQILEANMVFTWFNFKTLQETRCGD